MTDDDRKAIAEASPETLAQWWRLLNVGAEGPARQGRSRSSDELGAALDDRSDLGRQIRRE